jgi:hypothetical protein
MLRCEGLTGLIRSGLCCDQPKWEIPDHVEHATPDHIHRNCCVFDRSPCRALTDRFFHRGGTQAGWETINGTGGPSGTFSGYTDLAAGDITVSLANIAYNRTYANGSTADFPGTDLDAMYNDLLFRNNDSATVDVTISGLQADTYRITTHHLNAPNTPTQFDLIKTDSTGTSTVGNYAMGLGNASTFNPTVVSFEVESNGADPIVLKLDATVLGTGGNTGGWFGYNGLEIDVVPEPGSLALLGVGLFGLIGFGRRRKR